MIYIKWTDACQIGTHFDIPAVTESVHGFYNLLVVFYAIEYNIQWKKKNVNKKKHDKVTLYGTSTYLMYNIIYNSLNLLCSLYKYKSWLQFQLTYHFQTYIFQFILDVMNVSKTFFVYNGCLKDVFCILWCPKDGFFFVCYECLEDVFCMSLMSQRRVWYFMNISKTYVLYLWMTERCVWYIIDVLKTPCRCFKYLKDHFIVSFENCTL